MLDQTRSSRLWLLLTFIVGAVLAFALVPILGRSSAIVAPASMFVWMQGHGLQALAAFLWDVLVVYGLGVALPVIVTLLVIFRTTRTHHIAIAACLALGVLVSVYLLYPLEFGQHSVSLFELQWWQQGLMASLLLACAIALGIDRLIGNERLRVLTARQ